MNDSYLIVCYTGISVVVVGLFLFGLRIREWWQTRFFPRKPVITVTHDYKEVRVSLREEK